MPMRQLHILNGISLFHQFVFTKYWNRTSAYLQ